jgi:hypothetical protein
LLDGATESIAGRLNAFETTHAEAEKAKAEQATWSRETFGS